MNQSYSSNQKSQNAKFVIVTALVTLVILGIAVWGIVFVANYQNKNKGNGEVAYTNNALPGTPTPVSTTDQTESSSEDAEPESTEGVSATTEKDDSSVNTESNSSSSCSSNCQDKTADNNSNSSSNNSGKGGSVGTSASSVPNTGPEDFLPIVLLFGTFVAFLTSQKLVKRDII